ncbi:DUF1446 domain-containing protein [Streptomyces sp. XM4193]|nr:DUF1446 domain-containing protein [Streptomyces sp. XM4193]
MREMLEGGPLDVLTGDYLAELTMLILGRDRLKDPERGWARTYVRQLEETLVLARERDVKLVTNAGGLNPAGLAEAVRALAERLGVPVRIARVEGDDLLQRGWGEGVLTANAYLGGAGVTAALRAGADLVVTGRITDAAMVTGAAAAHHGWELGDWDELAGATVAGHVLECGTQATGGNYAFFTELDSAENPLAARRLGFPLAEIHADGSSVITKHPGTGGAVTTGTVTAQLLYETGPVRYLGPDVTTRLDTVRLTEDGPDRVRVDGVRGEPPPPTLKVGLTALGGHRNEVTFVLTGLDIEAKAAWLKSQVAAELRGREPAELRWTLARTDHRDAAVQEEAAALLRLVVRDTDPERVGRAVSGAAIELALGSVPGFHVTAPPGRASPYGVFRSARVPVEEVPHTVVLPDGTRQSAPLPPVTGEVREAPGAALPEPLPDGPCRRAPLGRVVGARSGDKGGDANIGLWARDDVGWRWLAHTLTVERLRQLLPETAQLEVVRHVLPNLRALNFTVAGLLGEGVAAQARFDPQAKALGEWLRARELDIPEVLL